MRPQAAAMVIVIAMLVGACGSADADPVAALPAEPSQAATGGPQSPLEQELGFSSEPFRRRQQLVRLQSEANERIVSCMASQGFQYWVGPIDALEAGAYESDGTREWAAQNGVGITLAYRDAVQAPAGAVASADEAAAANASYTAALAPSDAIAYDRALIGRVAGEAEPTADDVDVDVDAAEASDGLFAPEGCWADAYRTLVDRVDVEVLFERELDSLNSRLESDPRVAGLHTRWAGCMEAVGYRYQTPSEMHDDLFSRLLELEAIRVETGSKAQLAAAGEEVLAYERAAAVASFDCSGAFSAEMSELRNDYEREFLADQRFRIADLHSSSS